MTRRVAVTWVLLLASSLARAQVLDDEIEFENHVCVIELDETSPVLEGIGLSHEISYEASFEGTLYLSVMADPRIDPFLRVATVGGELLAVNDDSGGGKHAFLKREVKGGEAFVIHVAVKGGAPARVRFKLFEAKETDTTRDVAKEGQRTLGEAMRLRKAGDLGEARRRLRDAVLALHAVAGGEVSSLVADVVWQIGYEARAQLSDPSVALDAFAAARTFREGALPEDQADLQIARLNLAVTMRELGDLHGARTLLERVLEVFSRTVPEDHPHSLAVRGNLALTMRDLGDLSGARALEEKVLEVFTRTLPEDHPDLQRARGNLAITMRAQGDLHGARALEEKVLEVRSGTLPEDHPDLQRARGNLAITMSALGDLHGARTLLEKVLEVYSRTLPEDHPDLQAARANLAATMRDLGDLNGARALLEKVLEVSSRTLPEDHPDLQTAAGSLANTIKALGDLHGARALEEKVLEVRSGTLPEDHPDLQRARARLARTRACLGEPTSPENLALVRATVGALERPDANRSGRELEAFATMHGNYLGWILSPAFMGNGQELADLSFQAVETVRSAAFTRERLFKNLEIPEGVVERVRGLKEKLDREGAVTREAIFDVQGPPKSRSRDTNDFFAHVRERDRLERELADLHLELARAQGVAFRSDRQGIGAALEPGRLAVGYWRYGLETIDPKTHQIASPVPSYLAFIVKPDATLLRLELGPAQAIEAAVKDYRDTIGASWERGAARLAAEDTAERERQAGERLRALVLDPLLPHVGDAKHLILAFDDVLHLVPLGALPLGEGTVADRYEIEVRASLKEITVAKQSPLNPPSLLALGGIEYDRVAEQPPGEEPLAEAAGPDDIHRGTTRGLVRSGPWALGFLPLEETKGEVGDIAALFKKTFEDGEATVRLGRAASRQSLVTRAPKARFLHLATHGYFAPDSVCSMKDDRPLDEQLAFGERTSLGSQVRGFAPMELCGLALAGANLEPGKDGFIPGVMTADEIGKLDLRGCELVVLSACDTNVGERRAGQGIASLQQAVYGAGARSSLTSLWKVPDQSTRELMGDFYRRWWVQGKPKRQALTEAQEKLRRARDEFGRAKYCVRDWAAWVIVGRD